MQGDVDRPLTMLASGTKCSWFMPQNDPKTARKKWISAMKPIGSIKIDKGAVKALVEGKSLLPIGAVGTSGDFMRGDMVSIMGPDNVEYARGLAAYSVEDTNLIMGKHSVEIESILGYAGRSALVHRDDMVV
jgi:glutamate 5-kinase